MAFAIKGEITGLADVFRQLRNVDKKVRNRLLKKAIRAASKLVLTSAKAKVAVRTGLLRKSLGIKVKVYRKSGIVVGIVGPRTGYKGSGKDPDENPTNIAHLVEKGRKAVMVRTKKTLSDGTTAYGREAKAVPARPFLRPAFDENKAAAEALIRETILRGLQEQ